MAVVNFSKAAVVTAVVTAVAPGAALADAYMVKDSRGIVYFTDTPPVEDSRFTVIKRYKEKREAGAATNGHSFSPGGGPYDHLIAASARRHRLDPSLVKAVAKVESDFDRFSISSKGARGLMQLMPQTARMLKVGNVFDAAENIDGGAKYLRMMMDKYNGSMKLALAAYNAGPTAVDRHGGVPPYTETRNYINKVFSAYRRYSRGGAMGEAAASVFERNRETVVYKYRTGDGSVVLTDKPVGKRIVIRD